MTPVAFSKSATVLLVDVERPVGDRQRRRSACPRASRSATSPLPPPPSIPPPPPQAASADGQRQRRDRRRRQRRRSSSCWSSSSSSSSLQVRCSAVLASALAAASGRVDSRTRCMCSGAQLSAHLGAAARAAAGARPRRRSGTSTVIRTSPAELDDDLGRGAEVDRALDEPSTLRQAVARPARSPSARSRSFSGRTTAWQRSPVREARRRRRSTSTPAVELDLARRRLRRPCRASGWRRR